MTQTTTGRWFEQQRMAWIEEIVRIFGFINREHIQMKFGVSKPQASTDLNRFLKAHPTFMKYNLSEKRYEIMPSMRTAVMRITIGLE